MNDRVQTAMLDVERLEIVTSGDRLAAVGPAWTALWQDIDGLIFQSHAWITAWWETLPDRDQNGLRIGLAWSGDRLVAVMPLAIGRRMGLRCLAWAANSYTDYGDILVSADCPPAALHRLWKQICAAGGFDIAYLNRLLPDASARLLFAPEAGGVRLRLNHRDEISYRVAGPFTTGKAWFEGQTKKTRQNYRRGVKVMEEAGKLKFRLLGADEPLAPVLERLAAFKRKWMALRGHESELFDEGAPALASLVDVLGRAGFLRIFVLECDGAMIAVSINFVQRDTMMAFVTTYDPDFSRASPGMVLMVDYIRWAIDQGLTMVDFLCGAEPFKQRFATQSVTLPSVLGTRTVQGSLASFADRTRHAIRKIRSRHAGTGPSAQASDAAE